MKTDGLSPCYVTSGAMETNWTAGKFLKHQPTLHIYLPLISPYWAADPRGSPGWKCSSRRRPYYAEVYESPTAAARRRSRTERSRRVWPPRRGPVGCSGRVSPPVSSARPWFRRAAAVALKWVSTWVEVVVVAKNVKLLLNVHFQSVVLVVKRAQPPNQLRSYFFVWRHELLTSTTFKSMWKCESKFFIMPIFGALF